MSFKSSLIKIALTWTPKPVMLWGANLMLKDIAELTDVNLDLDARTAYLQIQLLGESETIEVWLEGFAILREKDAYQLIIQQARSNRLWLANLLARIAGKAWPIPVPTHMTAQMELVSELFKPENPEQEAN
ncbi:MAG: hypothetical protein ACXW03_08835 [Methylobacter sp.]